MVVGVKLKSIISDHRFILGLFREIEILGGYLLSEESNEQSRITFSLIHIELEGKSSSAIQLLFSEFSKPILKLSIEVEGQIYAGNSYRIQDGIYTLPQSLEALNLRSAKRFKPEELSDIDFFAEIRGVGWRRFCSVIDFNTGFVAIKTNLELGAAIANETIVVRIYSGSKQILICDAKIRETRLDADNAYLYVLSLFTDERSNASPESERRQFTRDFSLNRSQKEAALDLTIYWPREDGYKIRATIVDAGATGMRLCFNNAPFDLPVGAIAEIAEIHIPARVVWKSNDHYGFYIGLGGQDGVRKWVEFLDSAKGNSLSGSPAAASRRNILSALLKSGYLAGAKASFVKEEKGYELVVPVTESTSRWLFRCVKFKNRTLESHVSFLKMSDDSWMIQELGSASDQRGVGKTIIKDAILRFFGRESLFSSSKAVMLSLYDATLKFNINFWNQIQEKYNLPFFHSLVTRHPLNLTDFDIPITKEISFSVPSISDWDMTYESLKSKFSTRALSALGISGQDFRSPDLMRGVSESGYSFERQVLIAGHGLQPIGILVNFGLPTYANLTVTANHLWIIVKSRDDALQILSTLLVTQNYKNILSGVSQIVVLLSEPLTHTGSDRLFRDFRLMLSPIHQLLAMYGDSSDVE